MLSALCRERGLVLLIAGDPELARQVEAAGVHWPEALLVEARRWRGAFALQTASAHSRWAIWRAAQAGMDAALVSTVFASGSPSAGPPMGAARFRALTRAAGIPLYGLGGVSHTTASQIADSGALATVSNV